jgi:5S rRNA maturation endonuclease (ribonuclease M5)
VQTQYDYQDGDGRIVHSVIRTKDKDFFRVREVDGKKISNWDGVQMVPFNLPEIHKKAAVILVEGEKDVLTLKELGVTATTIPGGSNGWGPLIKKQPDFCQKYFNGKTIIIIPDNDPPGEKYMEAGAQFLSDGGAVVHTCTICKEMDKGADITDWIEANKPDRETLLDSVTLNMSLWEPKAPTALDTPLHVTDELKSPSTETQYDITVVFKQITQDAGSWSGDTFNRKCPAHEDRKASLSITMAEDKILMRCHAGCSFSNICDGLGIKPKHTFKTGQAHLKAKQQQIVGPRPGELTKICDEILKTDEPEEFEGIKAPIMDEYVRGIAKLTDAHPVIIYSTALASIGAQAQTRLVIQKGTYYVRLYPNIWSLSVAESGTYKTTALNAGAAPLVKREKEIIDEIIEHSTNMNRLIADGVDDDDPDVAVYRNRLEDAESRRRKLPDKSSWEACLDRIEKCGGGIWLLSEFGAWLSGLERTYNQGFKQTITELYDVPDTYEESTRTHGTRILTKPFISISGVSTIQFLSGLLSKEDASTGFLARFLLFRPPAKNTVPDALPETTKKEEDLESYNLLQEIYRQLSYMTVPLEYKLSAPAKKLFNEYHRSMYDRFYKMTDTERFWMEPFIKRLGPSALKIAMVSQFLIQSEQDVIDEHAMMSGISLVSYSEICTRFLFRRELGESLFQRKARCVKEYIAKRGGFVKKGQLHASHILDGGTKEYTNMCESLVARGEILIETVDGKWRPNSKITLVDTKG